ncbi:MAG: hypothetical protein IKA59_03700 [Clostridia bacterium]|nr:hypothetical protein [Clostridia bacterium]
MSKKARIITLVLIVLSLVVTLTACGLKDQIDGLGQEIKPNNDEKQVTIIVGEKTFEVTTTKAYLHEALKDLLAEGKIALYEYGSDESPYVVAIDVLEQDVEGGKYFSVWHNVDSFSLKCIWSDFVPSRALKTTDNDGNIVVTTMHKNQELFYSGVGIGTLPLVDGCTYAILVD